MSEYFLALIAMLVTFAVLCFVAKLHISLCMVASALAGCIVSGNGLGLRYLIEGSFSYLDTIFIIATAMIFMKVIEEAGTLEAISAIILRNFYKSPALLLILLTVFMMLPGMVTGSSTAAVLSVGAIVTPVLLMMGIDNVTAATIVAYGAILGMVAPPVNLPALMICSGVDSPFVGFSVPILLLVMPLAIILPLVMGLRQAHRLTKEEVELHLGENSHKKFGVRIFLPVIVLVAVIVISKVLHWTDDIAMPLTFLISALFGLLCGKKIRIIPALEKAIHDCVPVMGVLMGVGMFIEVMTLTGVRGLIVVGCLSLPAALMVVVAGISMPLFGAVSCFGSASVLGVPFALALLNQDTTITITALSLMAAMGDFIPPAALAGRISAKTAGVTKYGSVVRKAVLPITVSVVFAIVYILCSETIAAVFP